MAKIQYVTIRGVELCLFKLTCDVLFYHLVFSPHMVLEATVFGFVFWYGAQFDRTYFYTIIS